MIKFDYIYVIFKYKFKVKINYRRQKLQIQSSSKIISKSKIDSPLYHKHEKSILQPLKSLLSFQILTPNISESVGRLGRNVLVKNRGRVESL